MGRRTVNGLRMKRIVSEAERQAIRRAGELDKQIEKAIEINALDEDWYQKTIRVLHYISRDII